MPIDEELIARLERLAALRLGDEERQTLRGHLARIVDYVDRLLALDTAGREPWGPGRDRPAPRRPDEPRPSLPAEAALAQSPAAEPGFFSVPPVFGRPPADPGRPAGIATPGSVPAGGPPPAAAVAKERAAPRAVSGRDEELCRLTALEAARLLGRGEIAPADLARATRAAIAARDGELHAFTWLADADVPPLRAPDSPRPFRGIPYALKANILTRGHPADCSSRILAPFRSPYDATAPARLRESGALLIGKTNMDEFAMGSSTENSAWGPTRNPWDPARTPGGSSGGAAAAVAADLAFFALGSDTGGSVRQPAACCGLVGLKPTYGRVSRYGLVAFASSLDQIGPLAKDVADCAAVYAAIAGPDPRDSTCLEASLGDPLAATKRPARNLRLGVPWRVLETGLDADVAADFQSTLADLKGEGVEVVEIAWPALPIAVATYGVISTAEASANLARYDGVRYGLRVPAGGWDAMVAATRTAGFGPEVKLRILLGTFVLSQGYYEAYYRKALQASAIMRDDLALAFASCDAIALPTAPTAAFPLGARTGDPLAMYLSDVFTTPANLTGLPAISVPTGLDRDGLPLSVQLLAPALAEERLFTLAAAVERARGFRVRKEAAWRTRRS